MATCEAAVHLSGLEYAYGDRKALDRITLAVPEGESVAVLGPNGSGKSTLFGILSTLLPDYRGTVEVYGSEVRSHPDRVRGMIGVVFQSPSLDPLLTVRENLRYQGRLYGLSGSGLSERITQGLDRVDLGDRADDRTGTLSGGLARRGEIAKALMHEPKLLLLDEPSSGLDPAARKRLWEDLAALRGENGTTVLVTTHLIDEADSCDRVLILSEGKLVGQGTPSALKSEIGGEVLTFETTDPDRLTSVLIESYNIEAGKSGSSVRVETSDGYSLAAKVSRGWPELVTSTAIRGPNLEDVYFHLTGHPFTTVAEGSSQ